MSYSPQHSSKPPRVRVRGRRTGRVALAVGAVLVLLATAGASGAWYLLYRSDHDIKPGTPVDVTIAPGSNTRSIAEQLSATGVIDNALRFRLTTRDRGADGDLRAGEYQLTTGMSDDAVIERLEKGPVIRYVDVTIPEGFTVRHVALRFAEKTDISGPSLAQLLQTGAERFADKRPYLKGAYRGSLEGYLFPATYRVKEGATAEDVVEMMLDKFEAEFAEVDLTYARSKNLTERDIVIMASMIEREARLAKERPIISSVLYNRLKADMRLQICATVLYEMPPGTTRLTYADLESSSPYNTYRIAGLPPGPISNPGRAAIEAAAQPAKTKYLYYVLTGADGSHTFTTSYSAFQKAVGRSRELTGK